MKPLTVQDLVQEIESSSEQAPSPLGHLTAAVVAAERLSDMGDALVDHFVRRAREEGFSWAEVGQCMGVTKQAAQKRFVSERPDAHARQQDFLTEFAPSAAATVGLAGEEAVRLGHSYIGTEHLLLGLLRARDGVAARVLAAAGVVEAASLFERLPGEPSNRIVRYMAQQLGAPAVRFSGACHQQGLLHLFSRRGTSPRCATPRTPGRAGLRDQRVAGSAALRARSTSGRWHTCHAAEGSLRRCGLAER